MKFASLLDGLKHEMQDLYSAETQLVEALPKVIEAVTNADLKKGLKDHLAETKEHVNRLEEAFDELDADPKGEHCKGMEGLLKEGEKVIKEKMEDAVKDALIIGACQRVEHYEIAGYGTAIAMAKELGEDGVVEILEETLKEEKKADETLTKASKPINTEAAELAMASVK